MGIRRLNHAVLYVRDAQRSAAFYSDVLDFHTVRAVPGAVFMRAPHSENDHDLGLFGIGADASDSPAGQGVVGLYHLAWSVGTLAELAECERRLRAAGSLVGASDHITTKALYAKDPDGLEFEVSWLVPLEQVTEAMRAKLATRPLDLDAEITHWGANLVGQT